MSWHPHDDERPEHPGDGPRWELGEGKPGEPPAGDDVPWEPFGRGPTDLDPLDDHEDRNSLDDLDPGDAGRWSGRWPMSARGLCPRERWLWFEALWSDACMLSKRFRLSLRAGWWEDERQVEALAALASWVERYDTGEWDDPPGKLTLLYDLERVAELLRDGLEPFHPRRDRDGFLRFLFESGAQPPSPAHEGDEG